MLKKSKGEKSESVAKYPQIGSGFNTEVAKFTASSTNPNKLIEINHKYKLSRTKLA